jgi:hypothetical protein
MGLDHGAAPIVAATITADHVALFGLDDTDPSEGIDAEQTGHTRAANGAVNAAVTARRVAGRSAMLQPGAIVTGAAQATTALQLILITTHAPATGGSRHQGTPFKANADPLVIIEPNLITTAIERIVVITSARAGKAPVIHLAREV